jgi:hypothetical protein
MKKLVLTMLFALIASATMGAGVARAHDISPSVKPECPTLLALAYNFHPADSNPLTNINLVYSVTNAAGQKFNGTATSAVNGQGGWIPFTVAELVPDSGKWTLTPRVTRVHKAPPARPERWSRSPRTVNALTSRPIRAPSSP